MAAAVAAAASPQLDGSGVRVHRSSHKQGLSRDVDIVGAALGTGLNKGTTVRHRWELPDNYPVFTVVMVIYHYVERIWRILVTPILIYNIYDH